MDKSVPIYVDIETFNVLQRAAEIECRSLSMQIRWLVKNSNNGSVAMTPTLTPQKIVRRTATRKIRPTGPRETASKTDPATNLNKILMKFDGGLSLCSLDFGDIVPQWGETDASRELYALTKRGDIMKVAGTKPYYYTLTPLGRERVNEMKRNM